MVGENNAQINSFMRGMDTDSSYDMIDEGKYVYGENIRITTNNLIYEYINSNNKEGIVTPVEAGIDVQVNSKDVPNNIDRILAVASIKKVGVIIVRDITKHWYILRVEKISDDKFDMTCIYKSSKTTNRDKFSIVFNEELEDLYKLYVATSEDFILQFFINEDYLHSNFQYIDEYFASNGILPTEKVQISKQIQGQLKTQQLQYCYRFYKKYGQCSCLSVLTNKIQVFSNNRTLENGNKEDSVTNVGFQLKIPTHQNGIDFYNIYDRVQLYRLSYTKSGENPIINLIYDSIIYNVATTVNDTGIASLQELSMEEFAALNALKIQPTVIETNQNYMFAANIKDKSNLQLSEIDINTQSYSFNADGEARLYNNELYGNSSSISINKNNYNSYSQYNEYYMNPYADINKYANEEPVDSEKYAFDKDGFYGGSGSIVSWKFITTAIQLHDAVSVDGNEISSTISDIPSDKTSASSISKIFYIKNDGSFQDSGKSTTDYFRSKNIFTPILSYNDNITSSLLRSLRRNEVYRYGIVFYNAAGTRSDVYWIGDIRTPKQSEIPAFSIKNWNFIGDIDSSDTEMPILYKYTINKCNVYYEYMNGSQTSISPIIKFSVNKIAVYDDGREKIIDTIYPTPDSVTYEIKINYKDVEIDNNTGIITYPDDVSVITTLCELSWYLKWNDLWYSGKCVVYKLPKSTQMLINIADNEYNRNIGYDGDNTINLNKFGGYYQLQLINTGSITYNDIILQYDEDQEFIRLAIQNDDNDYGFSLYIICLQNDDLENRELSFKLGVKDNLIDYKIIQSGQQVVKSNIIQKTSISKPNNVQQQAPSQSRYSLYANPLGIEFDVDINKINEKILQKSSSQLDKIVGYQIVRCKKTDDNSTNLMQCVISRPVRQKMYLIGQNQNPTNSPYYPTPFISARSIEITQQWNPNNSSRTFDFLEPCLGTSTKGNASSLNNQNLFQIFSNDILYKRETTLQQLTSYDCYLQSVATLDSLSDNAANDILKNPTFDVANDPIMKYSNKLPYFQFVKNIVKSAWEQHVGPINNKYDKLENSFVFHYYKTLFEGNHTLTIKKISDVKNPLWNEGFSEIRDNGSDITTGIKQYKSFNTNVLDKEYVNWMAGGMYDISIGTESSWALFGNNTQQYRSHVYNTYRDRRSTNEGWVGPGPVCFLIATEDAGTTTPGTDNNGYFSSYKTNVDRMLSTSLCNICHTASQYEGYTMQQKQYDVYYGFGNFSANNKNYVFDGDIYITPCEFVSMFKTYDFQSIWDTLPSAQVINYIPMESKINTYLDYGMNYKNTQSKTLQLEPGSITGVATQDRPLNQTNPIFSENENSNDIFNAVAIDKTIDNFNQRIHYSQLKTNGESIDNWQLFKPIDFIDADGKYGEITNLLTNREILYFWQNFAFGKLSVNERSLVTDNNSNTVQLGQGGVLQRTDYINTQYGMRPQDFCAINSKDTIYWIDIQNDAICACQQSQFQNYGKAVKVQNLINTNIEKALDKRPTINHDIQNEELLCDCLTVDKNHYSNKTKDLQKYQMVFNTSYGIATALYNRLYDNIISFENVLYGFTKGTVNNKFTQYNYLEDHNEKYLTPTVLSFVVNKSPMDTKVFDNQKIVTLKRKYQDFETLPKEFMLNKYFTFTTDIQDSFVGHVYEEAITDREGNIQYTIPRFNKEFNQTIEYGNRLRGKWVKVDIRDNSPREDFSISKILTVFRKSYN